MAQTPVSTTSHTKAWMTLERNLEIISHMLDFGAREIDAVFTAASRVAKTPIGDLTKETERAKLARSLERLNSTLELRLPRRDTATLWQVVMLVTCIEAYLQDVLVDAATVDAAFMSKSEQVAPYVDVVAATSLDELANEMRRRWARGWLSDGGPKDWLPRLHRMGARGYAVGLAPRLELIWGIRHVTVHTAGVATADFLQRHPGAAKAVGDRVKVSLPQFKVYLAAVREFLETTENSFSRDAHRCARSDSLTARTGCGR